MIKFTLSAKQVSETSSLKKADDVTISVYYYYEKQYLCLEFEGKEFLIDQEDLFKVMMAVR